MNTELLQLDLKRFSPTETPNALLSQQLGDNCIMLVLDQWTPLEQDLLPWFMDSFKQAYAQDPTSSLLLYQNWMIASDKLKNQEILNVFLNAYFSATPQPPYPRIMTLPPVEESQLPTVLKGMKGVILLQDNTSMIGHALAMNLPVVLPHHLGQDWVAPFIDTFNQQQPDGLPVALQQLSKSQSGTLTPRHYIQDKINQQFNDCWSRIESFKKDQLYSAALEEFKRVAAFLEKRDTHEVHHLKSMVEIFEHNQLIDSANQVTDLVLFTTMPMVPKERSDSIYGQTFRTCFEFIKGNSIVGDVLEFGTYLGYTSKIATTLMHEYGIQGDFYTYDSFTGFDEISPEDQRSYEVAVNKVWTKDFLGFSQRVADRLALKLNEILPQRTHVIKGYFDKSLPLNTPKQRAALVNIDCDLYSPARFVLDFLLDHDLLQDGCVLLFDDYNCNRANPTMGERRALQEAFARQDRFTYTPWFSYGWSGQSFWVHDLAIPKEIQAHLNAGHIGA